MRIIIVEDEIKIREGMGKLIESLTDHIVLGEASDGEEGLDLVLRFKPDLVITDIRMPKMTGSEFLSYLKSNELFKHIPVMMLSSEESTTERIRLLEEGAVDYILKPFNPMELKVRLQKFL